jgi:hypothetical protein
MHCRVSDRAIFSSVFATAPVFGIAFSGLIAGEGVGARAGRAAGPVERGRPGIESPGPGGRPGRRRPPWAEHAAWGRTGGTLGGRQTRSRVGRLKRALPRGAHEQNGRAGASDHAETHIKGGRRRRRRSGPGRDRPRPPLPHSARYAARRRCAWPRPIKRRDSPSSPLSTGARDRLDTAPASPAPGGASTETPWTASPSPAAPG